MKFYVLLIHLYGLAMMSSCGKANKIAAGAKIEDQPRSGDSVTDRLEYIGKFGQSKFYPIFSDQQPPASIRPYLDAANSARGRDTQKVVVYLDPSVGSQKQRNLKRMGLWKALNSVALDAEAIYIGDDYSDGQGLVYLIDLSRIWAGNVADKWRAVTTPLKENGEQRLLPDMISAVSRMGLTNVPVDKPIEAGRLVYNLLFPNVYAYVIDTPEYLRDLLPRYGISRLDQNVAVTSGIKEAIVNGPRIIRKTRLPDGRGFWVTTDYLDASSRGEISPGLPIWEDDVPYRYVDPIPKIKDSTGSIDLPAHLDTHTFSNDKEAYELSEGIVEMRNGLLAFYLWGNANQRRGRARHSVVVDHFNDLDRTLVVGRSCMACHANGFHHAGNDMATYAAEGKLPSGVTEKALAFWTSEDELANEYERSEAPYKAAIRNIAERVIINDAKLMDDIVAGFSAEPTNMIMAEIEQPLLYYNWNGD